MDTKAPIEVEHVINQMYEEYRRKINDRDRHFGSSKEEAMEYLPVILAVSEDDELQLHYSENVFTIMDTYSYSEDEEETMGSEPIATALLDSERHTAKFKFTKTAIIDFFELIGIANTIIQTDRYVPDVPSFYFLSESDTSLNDVPLGAGIKTIKFLKYEDNEPLREDTGAHIIR